MDKTQETTDQKLDKVFDILGDLNSRVVKLETPKEAVTPVAQAPQPAAPASIPGVPADYVKHLHTTLNQEFGIEVESKPDVPAFALSILVPEKYSNAGKPHWETLHEDRRTKVIDNSLGINGVKDWIDRIFNSFPPETRTMIIQDRHAA